MDTVERWTRKVRLRGVVFFLEPTGVVFQQRDESVNADTITMYLRLLVCMKHNNVKIIQIAGVVGGFMRVHPDAVGTQAR